MRALLLLLAFIGVPALEIFVLIQVGGVIGIGWAILLVLAVSVAGGWLLRREGKRAWDALRTAVEQGKLPDKELLDAALVLVGGTLLLTPGFVTDVFGLLLMIPVTRPAGRAVARWAIGRHLAKRAEVIRTTGAPSGPFGPFPGGPGAPGTNGTGTGRGPVVEGEIVDP